MDKHSEKYEQYCWVKDRNIIFEETVFHNGKRCTVCTELSKCKETGGCKNKALKELWEKNEDSQLTKIQ